MTVWNAIIAVVASVVAVLVAAASAVSGSSETEVLKRFAPMEAHIDQKYIEVAAKSSIVICAQTYPFAPSGFRFAARYGHTKLVDKTGYDRIGPRRCALYVAPTATQPFSDQVDIVLRGEVLDSARVMVHPASPWLCQFPV